jgi:hypothetical protein
LAVFTLSAQTDIPILARDDLDFARALVRHGYPDLAEELLAEIESAKRPDQDPLQAGAVRLELRGFEAYAETDPIRQGELLQALVADMEAFVQKNPGTPAAENISERLLELYRGFGERVAGLLRDEETAAEAEKLRAAADTMFQRAADTLKKDYTAKVAERDAQDPENPDPELDRRVMLAAYNLARTYYFHGQLLQETFAKQRRLDAALDTLADIQLDFPDQLLCYEGYIYEGLCHKELGDPEAALDSFDFAIGLRDTYERGSNGLFQIAPEAADIVSSGVLQKMLLLNELGRPADAVGAARDFAETIPEAAQTLKGLSILVQEAEALRALGDEKELAAAAQRLIEIDPRGPGGELGRELLGSSTSSLGAVDAMRLAESSARRGDFEQGVRMCQEVLAQAGGTAGEADLGAQASLLLGALFAQHGRLHEAVVAWGGVTDRYGQGKDAPECLWRAANGYLALQGQERSAYYRDGAREAMVQLSTRYPDHPYASMAAIIEGQQLEAEQQFVKAAEIYERIPEGTPGHEEGLYRAGNARARFVRQLAQEGKTSEVGPAADRAQRLLEQARADLEQAAEETLDIAAQDRLRNLAFNARVSLANLFLIQGVDREADVQALLAGIEQEFPGDEGKAATARALELKALQAMGKIDEAVAILDAQLRQDPSGRELGSSAAAVAKALDERGVAQLATDPAAADASWRKAAGYYWLAVRGQVEGEQAARVDELEPIANRLLALALHFSGVPESIDSFVDWTGGGLDENLLSQAARAYEAVLPLTPSYRTHIKLARTLGFLGRYEDAAASYVRLFERENFANTATRTIDPEALRAKPELAYAFLEWGVCEREVGVAQRNSERLARASAIFESLVVATSAGTKLWWPAKFYQIQTLDDRGEYGIAAIALRDLERNWPDYDAGEFGLRDRFQQLSQDLAKKAPR